MRHLTEYLHSSTHQTATPSSDDAAELKLSQALTLKKTQIDCRSQVSQTPKASLSRPTLVNERQINPPPC